MHQMTIFDEEDEFNLGAPVGWEDIPPEQMSIDDWMKEWEEEHDNN